MGFNITVVGLGIMGGSLAKALHGWRGAQITGIEIDESVLERAIADRAIDRGFVLNDDNAKEALGADVTLIALFPNKTMDFLEKYAKYAKRGSVWSDICGVKAPIVSKMLGKMPSGAEYIGSHPMAGKETYGYPSSDGALFEGCNFVLTPTVDNTEKGLDVMRELARYVGAAHIIETSPQHHDMMIAYTSQMAHVLAAAIVNSGLLYESKGYEGGSFRDLTRVGTLNPDMWSELFVINKRPLCQILSDLEHHIADIRRLIEKGSIESVRAVLAASTARKAEYLRARYKM